SIHTLAQDDIGALLVSEDNKATLVLIELSTPLQDRRNQQVVDDTEQLIADLAAAQKIPAGLQVHVTGSATAGRDLDRAETDSAHSIEVWTIGIVVVLLLLIYRAPLLAFIPLATVFVAVAVSLPLLSSLAELGIFAPSRDLRIFVIVLVYGAGVDYCLFLI